MVGKTDNYRKTLFICKDFIFTQIRDRNETRK